MVREVAALHVNGDVAESIVAVVPLQCNCLKATRAQERDAFKSTLQEFEGKGGVIGGVGGVIAGHQIDLLLRISIFSTFYLV